MSESGIYIRVGKNNVLLEDLYPIERIEWLNGLEKEGLIRTVNLLCDVIEDFKVNYQNSILENQKLKADYGTKVQVERDMLQQENQELKKQLEEKENPLKGIFAQVNDDILLRDCANMNTEINELKNQQKEFIEYMEDKIYSIEPKGTGIIYNCEYDSEEYFISAMKEQSRLNTLKEDLSKYKKIIGVKDE